MGNRSLCANFQVCSCLCSNAIVFAFYDKLEVLYNRCDIKFLVADFNVYEKYEKYHKKRREQRRLFRRKKHEFVKAECEEIEMHGSRNNARKFFQKIKRMSEGFKTGASYFKAKMVTW